MIGYYVHHVGRGHLHRAETIIASLDEPVTVLSSLPRPARWSGDWVQLPRDDEPPDVVNPTANGVLHWAPLHHLNYRSRMAAVTFWIAQSRPSVLVCDVSVEMAVLGRLLGVAVVTMALPGDRSDAPHQLCFRIADAIIAPWPNLHPAMSLGLTEHGEKVHHVGALSRYTDRPNVSSVRSDPPRVLCLSGAGGGSAAPEITKSWTVIERSPGNWVEDVWDDLCTADVVVTSCGLGALADVAAACKPVVLVPAARPHDEQMCTARGLATLGVGVAESRPSRDEWSAMLTETLSHPVQWWLSWHRHDAAARAAAVIAGVRRS